MSSSTNQKDKLTKTIRQLLKEALPEAYETDRAEASLCELSFQSHCYPERHVWIDTDEDHIKIDLEDWQNEDEWDNAVARVTVESLEDAVSIVKTWLSGDSLNQYSNLNQDYRVVKKVGAIALTTHTSD